MSLGRDNSCVDRLINLVVKNMVEFVRYFNLPDCIIINFFNNRF